MKNSRIWLSAAQFALVILGGGWLITIAVQQDQLNTRDFHWGYLVGAIVLNTIALTTMGIRLRTVAAAARLVESATRFVTLNFRSIFYLFVLPLGVGMESARYIGFRHIFNSASRANVVRVIITDRGLGLLTSLAFAGVAWLAITNAKATFGLALALSGLAAIGAVASVVVARITSLDTRKILAASGLSIVIHALTCTSVWMLTAGIGLEVDLWLVMLAISAGVFGAIIPLALAGVQAGDFVAAGVLDLSGVDTVTALTVATLYYLTRLEGACIGALLELRRSSAGLLAELGKPTP